MSSLSASKLSENHQTETNAPERKSETLVDRRSSCKSDKISVKERKTYGSFTSAMRVHFLATFKEELKPCASMRSCHLAKYNLSNDLVAHVRKRSIGIASVASVPSVKKITTSLVSVSNAFHGALHGLRSKNVISDNCKKMQEDLKRITDDKEQFRMLKEDMRRRNLVTNFAIEQNLEEIIKTRQRITMMEASKKS